MDDAAAGELEVALADAGLLLVQLEKYRAGTEPAARALRRRALDLGDHARRLHHRGDLEPPAAEGLLGDARALLAALHSALATIRNAPGYRAAVEAHAAGDAASLRRLLPEIFDDLEPFAATGELFYPVPWRRRGRPRPPAELAAEVVGLRDDGLAPDGDDLAPGVDPALPAVALAPEPPDDEVVVLRVPRAALPASTFRRRDGGDVLVHCPRLRVPFTVDVRPDLDAEALEELGGLDYPPYRAAVAAALAAAGVSTGD